MKKKLTPKQRVLKKYPQSSAFRGMFGETWYVRFGRYTSFMRTSEYSQERDAWAAAARELRKP